MNPMQLLHHTQFHGANRLADKTSRWYWVPALLFLLASAITLVILTISRYEESPTYLVQMERVFQIKKFPTVVLCPEIHFLDEKMDQFVTEVKYPPGLDSVKFRKILPQLAAYFAYDVQYNLNDLLLIEQFLEYNALNAENVGKQLTASCEETLIKCRWGKVNIKCTDLFRMELTGDGFCCVFNGRSLRRELEEHRSNIQKTKPKSHWYTKRFGYTSGLMIAVNQSQKPFTINLSYKWIALLTSQHFVDMTINGTALNPGSEQWIALYTRTFQIDQQASLLSPHLRKCKMSTETLKYFPSYSKKYCLLENEIANTLKNCKCVRLVHPRPLGAARCRAKMLHCAILAAVPYDSHEFDCPSTCDVDMDYSKASSFMLDKTVNPIDPFYKGLDFKKVTVVRVFIQNRRQNSKERWTYFTYLDLFSQLGGMFSVFFGCSVLTLAGLLQLAWRVLVTIWQKCTRCI